MYDFSISLPKGYPAMTLYELDAPRAQSNGGLLKRMVNRIGNAIRIFQFGRMMQAMSELSDPQLEALGLKRSDIPRYAHECIYGVDA